MTARENLVRATSEKEAAESQLQQLREDRESLKESMQAFSAEQMEKNRDQFLKHAEERLGVSESKHASELEKRHDSIENSSSRFVSRWKSLRNSIGRLKSPEANLSVLSINRSNCSQNRRSRWGGSGLAFDRSQGDRGKPAVAGAKWPSKIFASLQE